MTVWPSVGSTGLGKALGRIYRIKEGFGPLSFGRLALLATIPIGLGLYLSLRLPWAIKRYRLTNRRVAVEVGINPRVMQFVSLEGFDSIEVDVSQGQEWYACGDLVFSVVVPSRRFDSWASVGPSHSVASASKRTMPT